MKRTLIALIAVVGLSTAGNAATLSVVADNTVYNVNDPITLTVTGDAQGAASLAAFARVLFGGSGGVAYVSGTQSQTTTLGIINWTLGALSGDGSGANAINQLAGPVSYTHLTLPTNREV